LLSFWLWALLSDTEPLVSWDNEVTCISLAGGTLLVVGSKGASTEREGGREGGRERQLQGGGHRNP